MAKNGCKIIKHFSLHHCTSGDVLDVVIVWHMQKNATRTESPPGMPINMVLTSNSELRNERARLVFG